MNMERREEKMSWTDKEEEFLKKNYQRLRDSDIAKILGKTQKSVTMKRLNLGLKKIGGFPKYLKCYDLE